MQILSLFNSDVFFSKAGVEEQRVDLFKQIMSAKKKTNENIPNSNTDCWRTFAEWKNIDWLYDHVINETKKALEYYTNENIDEEFKRVTENDKQISLVSWTNVNSPGSKNVIHDHKEFSFSAIYYVSAEGTGPIIFKNPANLLSNCTNKSPFTRTVTIRPKNGHMILWPSWIPHEVEPNPSKEDRVNVVFNIMIGKPPTAS